MSESIDFEGGASGDGGRQGGTCVSCQQPLVREYWEANGKVACTSCKQRIDQAGTGGTPASRFLMASALGTGAMALGTVVWWAVANYTGFEAAIIAIGIGWLVGNAVRMGAQGRGGWLYQLMAASQTYLAIVFAYMFLGYGALDPAKHAELGIATWPVLFVISLAAPFLSGWGSILSIIIVGVGLVTAWQKNRKLAIEWSGPHAIGSAWEVATTPEVASPPSSGTVPPPPPLPLPQAKGGANPGPPPLPPKDGGS